METTTENLVKWAETIPLEELFLELRQITGINDLKFTSRIVERRGEVSIVFESQDLVDKVGFLKLIFKTIKISQFNSSVYYKQHNEDDEPIPMYWGTADFSYDHPSGGSNGCTFLSFSYDDNKGWQFKKEA